MKPILYFAIVSLAIATWSGWVIAASQRSRAVRSEARERGHIKTIDSLHVIIGIRVDTIGSLERTINIQSNHIRLLRERP